jgi:protein-tyrosine phosphatase
VSVAKVRICFVCLGNICRSPTAEGVMRALIDRAGLVDRVVVESAGTGDWHVGEPSDPRTRAEAKRRGYSLDGRAQTFRAKDFARFDYVLAMDASNRDVLVRLAPDAESRAKIALFRSYEASDEDVPDPYYGGDAGFREVLDICERTCGRLLESLRERHGW